MNRTTHILATLCAVSLTACCCYQPEPLEPTTLPIVREATLAEFDNRYNGNSPSPTFNIATFKFPSTERSSGDLPNDQRFEDGPFIVSNADYPVNGAITTARFQTPPNSMIAGDWVVDRITLQPTPVAYVRVRGWLHRLPANPLLMTDDAGVFAREIAAYNDTMQTNPGRTVCETLYDRSLLYGTADVDNQVTAAQITVTESGAPSAQWSYPTSWPTRNGSILPALRSPVINDVGYYTIQMRVGEWYFYRAVNGASFFVLVSAVREGELSPFVRRITFKFSESYQCYNCE